MEGLVDLPWRIYPAGLIARTIGGPSRAPAMIPMMKPPQENTCMTTPR